MIYQILGDHLWEQRSLQGVRVCPDQRAAAQTGGRAEGQVWLRQEDRGGEVREVQQVPGGGLPLHPSQWPAGEGVCGQQVEASDNVS